jgi:hypothetical protein
VVDVQTGPEPAPAAAGPRPSGPAAAVGDHWVGLLRVTRVRLVVTPVGTTAYAEGTRRWRRVSDRIPLSRVAQLRAAGVPVTLEHRR